MEKIDKRHHYVIQLDTETANGLEDALPYDIGYAVIDTNGKIYLTRSFVNADIFYYRALMNTAYYANKIPMYEKDIADGKRIVKSMYEIREQIKADIKQYQVDTVIAHNARFDIKALNNLIRYRTASKFRYFFPKGIEIWDTLLMARSVIGKMPTYQKYCIKNGYVYGNDQLRMTAEILYKFISKNDNFNESHTGLEDVIIENEIYKYCKKQHKKMNKVLYAR